MTWTFPKASGLSKFLGNNEKLVTGSVFTWYMSYKVCDNYIIFNSLTKTCSYELLKKKKRKGKLLVDEYTSPYCRLGFLACFFLPPIICPSSSDCSRWFCYFLLCFWAFFVWFLHTKKKKQIKTKKQRSTCFHYWNSFAFRLAVLSGTLNLPGM